MSAYRHITGKKTLTGTIFFYATETCRQPPLQQPKIQIDPSAVAPNGAPENRAPTDAAIAGPFDDGHVNYVDREGEALRRAPGKALLAGWPFFYLELGEKQPKSARLGARSGCV